MFPAPGVPRAWPLPREGGGGPLTYGNFRKRYWAPTLKRLGLPAVTPHSARHSFISTLQAQGVEVGLVAKLAGHKSAVVTLSHYTHAMRGGEDAVKALDRGVRGERVVNGRATGNGGAKRPRERTGLSLHESAGRSRAAARSARRSQRPEDRADRAAKGEAGAIEKALRLLGRRGGADRERELPITRRTLGLLPGKAQHPACEPVRRGRGNVSSGR